ncbi:hypothetical protein BGZ74_007992 [Mortierella antarctica]|nr:hypothetical protein BGZ74_007992 [Mortierella antarctica]
MKLVLTVIATLLLVSACDSCGLAKRHIPTIHWDYGADHSGPSHWSILDPAYVICSDTMNQSPIDFNPHTIGPIAACENVDLAMDYKPLRNAVAHWNGHTVEVDWTPSRGMHNNSITLKGKKYNLVQFHFHTPSEHRVNNRHADAELHFVHRSPEDQALAVVGVLLEVVAQNVRLFDFVKVLHDKVNVPCAGVHGEEVAVDKEEVDGDEDGEEAEEEKDAEDEDEDQEGVFEAQHMESYEDGHVDKNQDNDTDIDDDVQGVDPVPLVNPDSYFENFNNDGHSKNDLCHGRALTSEDAVKIDVPLKVVNFAPLLRVLGAFTDRWVYQGSLTTPPCSEHVSWNVMQKTFPIGIQQLKALVALQGFNARGIMENRIQKEEDGAGPK